MRTNTNKYALKLFEYILRPEKSFCGFLKALGRMEVIETFLRAVLAVISYIFDKSFLFSNRLHNETMGRTLTGISNFSII